MKKNEIYTVEIVGINAQGMGVCRIDGMAVFVANTAVGDQIKCKIVKVLKNYAFAIVNKIIKNSADRQQCDCDVFTKCGGCVFRHLKYSAEGDIKLDRVHEAISRIGGYKDFELEGICLDENRNRYRNKAQIPLDLDKDGNLTMGFYGQHSHRVVNMNDCLLQPIDFTDVMNVFRAWHDKFKVSVYNEEANKGLLRHLYIRKGEISNELMVCVVINGNELPFAKELYDMILEKASNMTSFIININKEKTNVILGKKCVTLFGKDFITDTLCGLEFNVSPLSFFQVNRSQAEKLYEKASEYADLQGGVLLDLYCGAGTIGLSMAHKAKKLIGVEIIPQAIENAKNNAKNNNIDNAEFICGDASKAANILNERGEKPEVIVVDPPRKGLDKQLIDTIALIEPEKLVYISCDPATLARDLKLFAEKGYILQKAKAYDLFPATSHVETVALLVK